MDKRLARELIKSRKAVKEKFQSLKLAASTTQSHLEQTYKPITQPLKQLISTIGQTELIDFKQEPIDYKDELLTPKAYKTSTPTKVKHLRKTGKTPVLPSELPSFFDTSIASLSELPRISQLPPTQDISVIAETTPPSTSNETIENENISDILEQTRQSIQTYVDTPGYKQWLENFHDLPRTYIDDGVRDSEHKFDHNYGIVHDIERDKFFLGLTLKPVEIIGKDIRVENITYPGTVGLYELLFKKNPVGYKKEDLDNYMDILGRTNAYRRNFNPDEQVQGTTSTKYITIIGPYLQKNGITKSKLSTPAKRLMTEFFSKPIAPYRSTRQRKGKGLKMKVTKANTDYIFWDNINELVDRLRLLLASTSAGHTGHSNEIISIVEELKEAKVIL